MLFDCARAKDLRPKRRFRLDCFRFALSFSVSTELSQKQLSLITNMLISFEAIKEQTNCDHTVMPCAHFPALSSAVCFLFGSSLIGCLSCLAHQRKKKKAWKVAPCKYPVLGVHFFIFLNCLINFGLFQLIVNTPTPSFRFLADSYANLFIDFPFRPVQTF